MKKSNQANLLARECIVTALMHLADQKPLSTISISELAKRAGVSRMTYYRNYSSKEEVFQDYMDEIIESYKNEIRKLEPQETYGDYVRILHSFKYFEKYKDFIRCILKIEMGYLLLDALSSYMIETYYKEIESYELYYILQAYAGSLFNTYIAWLKNDSSVSAEDMTMIIYKLYHKI
ncbi:TetR/AcrR family transcriptional regulator [Konateibacter massiliensis]|uniref:TetR/AcrR family transcriptional regulator n=1 Tax=Konateibacter massiliensis TaxID=2002841 RepID=UPI000C14DBF9|nr:TetR/AcrR family transcriptional regulator [Konateibacter massiliensis]